MVQSSQALRSTKNIKHKRNNNQTKTPQETIHKQLDTADILPQKKRNPHMGPTNQQIVH